VHVPVGCDHVTDGWVIGRTVGHLATASIRAMHIIGLYRAVKIKYALKSDAILNSDQISLSAKGVWRTGAIE